MKFLITAGPTREPFDPVRFLSNRSSGKMGYAIAEAAAARGHEVTLVSGPVSLSAPAGVDFVPVMTAREMREAVVSRAGGCGFVVCAAAVCDYAPRAVEPRKRKKDGHSWPVELVETPDILHEVSQVPDRKFYVAGFAAETDNVLENARQKLAEKNADAIIANDVSHPEIGFESSDNQVTLIFKNGQELELPRMPKKILGQELVKIFEEMAKEPVD